MSKLRLAVCTGFAASALLLIPAGSASAHVHGITPLLCTDAPANSGGAAGAILGVREAADQAGLAPAVPIPVLRVAISSLAKADLTRLSATVGTTSE